ncbi:RAD52 motif-containing protein 1 isoform X2 [Thalassophryne amazonica]|nr:RAD52 motif-containing protein 1 isoform X2 [Thalassophryne amazonica]
MPLEVDILEFVVPVENNKTLLIWDIEPSLTAAQIHVALCQVFSTFGPLYLVKVCPNAPVASPGFYAIIKFYSAAQASKAQRQTDGQMLFQTSPLKVRLSSRQTPSTLSRSTRLLSHTHCLDLANHCLGFNSWSSHVITLKELSDDDDEELLDGQRRFRFCCLIQLTFPHHGQTTRGVAVVEDTFMDTGPELVLQKRGKLQKSVREEALVQAFSTVLLVLLGNRKVMVEVKQNSNQFLHELTEGAMQVNEWQPDVDDDLEEQRQP